MKVKTSLLNHFREIHASLKRIKCALIKEEGDFSISLKCNYEYDDLNSFFDKLDFEYDDNDNVINGFVWYEDGTLSELVCLDGIDKWVHHSIPPIPENLL